MWDPKVDERIATQVAVKVLNEAFEADPDAISSLFSTRVSCNSKLAVHRTIQVRAESPLPAGQGDFTIGTLGVINGILLALSIRPVAIAAWYDPETGALLGFGEVDAQQIGEHA